MTSHKIVVHTDVLLAYLTHRSAGPSVLREAMSRWFCYTTVFNAIELFSIAKTKEETCAIGEALSAMKILGLNAKQAPKYGTLFGSAKKGAALNLLTAGLCLESRLPLLTARPAAFRGVKGLVVITPRELSKAVRDRDPK